MHSWSIIVHIFSIAFQTSLSTCIELSQEFSLYIIIQHIFIFKAVFQDLSNIFTSLDIFLIIFVCMDFLFSLQSWNTLKKELVMKKWNKYFIKTLKYCGILDSITAKDSWICSNTLTITKCFSIFSIAFLTDVGLPRVLQSTESPQKKGIWESIRKEKLSLWKISNA